MLVLVALELEGVAFLVDDVELLADDVEEFGETGAITGRLILALCGRLRGAGGLEGAVLWGDERWSADGGGGGAGGIRALYMVEDIQREEDCKERARRVGGRGGAGRQRRHGCWRLLIGEMTRHKITQTNRDDPDFLPPAPPLSTQRHHPLT